MRNITVLLALCLSFSVCRSHAQSMTFEEVDQKTIALYNNAQWSELLRYGKAAISQGQDFLLLRLRMGYAAFLQGDYSRALAQYDKALQMDSYNETAHYFSLLCLLYLNQRELATAHAPFCGASGLAESGLKKIAFTDVDLESSIKQTDLASRGNGWYGRLGVGTRLAWNVNMYHALAFYRQTLNEPLLEAVRNNNNIQVNQVEYYNRTAVNLNRKWQLIGAFHYLNTPFNNYTYNNLVGLLGIKYHGGYFDVQANGIAAQLTDSAHQQVDLRLGLFPLGNMNLYAYSTAMFRNDDDASFNFKEVVGCKVLKNTWLEANATFGRFRNLVENDALYVYNAIDRNTLKAGGTLYYSLSRNVVAQVNFTWEERQLYNCKSTFHQYSTTGGLSWKF